MCCSRMEEKAIALITIVQKERAIARVLVLKHIKAIAQEQCQKITPVPVSVAAL